jgi:hypothetical protein
MLDPYRPRCLDDGLADPNKLKRAVEDAWDEEGKIAGPVASLSE